MKEKHTIDSIYELFGDYSLISKYNLLETDKFKENIGINIGEPT